MADNTRGGSESGTAPLIATDEVTYSGETADVQLVRIVNVEGAEGSKTVAPITTGVQYVEDTAIPTAGQGTLVVGRRDDALSALAEAEGDAVGLRVSSNGALWIQVSGGGVAHDEVDSGNPVKFGGKASSAAPTAVASGDRVDAWFSVNGAQMTSPVAGEGNGADAATGGLWSARGGGTQGSPMPSANYIFNGGSFDRMRGDITNGVDVDVTRVPRPDQTIGTALAIGFTATTAQTSVNLLAGTGGQRIYVTNLTISTGGTTAGRVSIYWGTGAFSAGTSVTLFDGEFAPSASARPGAVMSFPVPVGGASATGDNLRITTSTGITVYVTGQAYKA